jgi:hypothetical protein
LKFGYSALGIVSRENLDALSCSRAWQHRSGTTGVVPCLRTPCAVVGQTKTALTDFSLLADGKPVGRCYPRGGQPQGSGAGPCTGPEVRYASPTGAASSSGRFTQWPYFERGTGRSLPRHGSSTCAISEHGAQINVCTNRECPSRLRSVLNHFIGAPHFGHSGGSPPFGFSLATCRTGVAVGAKLRNGIITDSEAYQDYAAHAAQSTPRWRPLQLYDTLCGSTILAYRDL